MSCVINVRRLIVLMRWIISARALTQTHTCTQTHTLALRTFVLPVNVNINTVSYWQKPDVQHELWPRCNLLAYWHTEMCFCFYFHYYYYYYFEPLPFTFAYFHCFCAFVAKPRLVRLSKIQQFNNVNNTHTCWMSSTGAERTQLETCFVFILHIC